MLPFKNKKYHQLSDEDLMRYVLKGKTQAYEEVYNRYADLLYRYFYRMLWRNQEKAQDFTHDLFLKIINKPESFDINRNFKTWIYSVANNMCKNEYKKIDVRKGGELPLQDFGYATDEHLSFDLSLDWDTFYHHLYIELEKLDEIQKTTFILRFKEELSIKEIAEVTQSSEGTVKSRLFYMLKKLGPKLEKYHPKKTMESE